MENTFRERLRSYSIRGKLPGGQDGALAKRSRKHKETPLKDSSRVRA